MRRTLRRTSVALAAALGVGLAPAALGASAVTHEVDVVGVSVSSPAGDLDDGLAFVTVALALRSDTALPDVLPEWMNLWGVGAEPVEGSRPWLTPGEHLAWAIWWHDLTRVSGTPTDGIWRGLTEVSSAWTGTWLVSTWYSPSSSDSPNAPVDLTAAGATITLGDPSHPPWLVRAAPSYPVKVVTGSEQWSPRIRVTNRLTDAPIAAAVDEWHVASDVWLVAQRTSPPVLPRADVNGYWTGEARPVWTAMEQMGVDAWGGRGSRGYSWEGSACVSPLVKWQANEHFVISGRTVTASGNAWPAPSIFRAVNPWIHLQVLRSGRWTTVASAVVRANGRYTVVWTAPAAGTYAVRVYKPGGALACAQSVGTVLAPVSLTLP